MKDPEIERACKWTLHREIWQTECKNELLNAWTDYGFKFCPFCGGGLITEDGKSLEGAPTK